MVTLIIRSEKRNRGYKGSKKNSPQVEAVSTPDTATDFLSVIGQVHLTPYFSLGLNSSHNILHGAGKLYVITENNQSSKPHRLWKERLS